MKIITEYYELWREDLEKYFIKNIDIGSSSITYSLYSVQNSVETLVGEEDILLISGTTGEVTFVNEGIYTLKITDVVTTSYSIRYFPTLKNIILTLAKEQICNCNGIDDTQLGCTSSSKSPSAQYLYDFQFSNTSLRLYLDLLLSQDFIRDYRSCFNVILTDDSVTLLSLMDNIVSNMQLNGNISNSTHLTRLYNAYLYLLLYVIELDTAEYTEETTIVVNPETALVNALFDITTIASCFNDLNINPTTVMSKLDDCYKTKPFSGNGICEEQYFGIYWDVKSTSEFPSMLEITNGNKYEADIVDSFSIAPGTSIYQYGWFAVPVGYSAKFEYWEEERSAFNRSVIGGESSTEFIILAPITQEINGVEYYIYKYNWSSLFTGTLRLSVTV